MYRVIEREYPEAERECLLVLDAATARTRFPRQGVQSGGPDYRDSLDKTGRNRKGGIVITIADMFDIPVKFIGAGEEWRTWSPLMPRSLRQAC